MSIADNEMIKDYFKIVIYALKVNVIFSFM